MTVSKVPNIAPPYVAVLLVNLEFVTVMSLIMSPNTAAPNVAMLLLKIHLSTMIWHPSSPMIAPSLALLFSKVQLVTVSTVKSAPIIAEPVLARPVENEQLSAVRLL